VIKTVTLLHSSVYSHGTATQLFIFPVISLYLIVMCLMQRLKNKSVILSVVLHGRVVNVLPFKNNSVVQGYGTQSRN
jgi:hypothetical protein